VTSTQGNDDGPQAERRSDVREEFRQMVHADPLLARLAQHSYPHLRLRSTFLISAVTLVLALLTQNAGLAAVFGVVVLAGHGAVVHQLAVHDEQGSKVMLTLLRGGCTVAIVLLVGTFLSGPSGSSGSAGTARPSGSAGTAGSAGSPGWAGLSRQSQQTPPQPATGSDQARAAAPSAGTSYGQP
jgi:hypothetical protein